MAEALWYWHRLRAMGAAEMWHRLVEKVQHITEPFARIVIKNVRLTQEPVDCPALPSRESAPALLKQKLACDAAKLLDGKWSLFGWKEVQVSSPPDWHRDYMRGVSAPSNGKLNHRSLPDGADARAIWEINRWAEPVRLAMHGWLNEDINAIKHAQSWLADWVEKNPVGQGINWTSALEGGLRLINFCWIDAMVSEMGDERWEMGESQRRLRDTIVPAHVWWVKRYLSFGSSANNHRLGEITGLLIAVKRWPELERIAGNAEELWDQITDCVLTQFAEDGGNREQALHYHLFAFEMALHACRAMNVNSGPVVERLQHAAEFFVRMSHPQEPWDYGDSDDAQIVPLTMRRDKAVAEWCAWISGETERDATALYFWIGDFPVRNPQSAIRNRDWWIAKKSGMAVIERDGWKVRVDASPLGFGKMAAHGHCDALHVSIWDGEHALVIDPGTGGYFGSKELRAELASWNAHNGPQPVGAFKTPRRAGTFLWAEHHETPISSVNGEALQCEMQHEEHSMRRSVAIADGIITVTDCHTTGHPVLVAWILAPECEFDAPVGVSDKTSLRISRNGCVWTIEASQGDGKYPRLVRTLIPVSRCFGLEQDALILETTSSCGQLTTRFKRINP
ncbi:MAG: heparinase II/III family protein [Verrucomicrobiaceae bacterium]